MSTAKVSVAIGEEELQWARSLARREGKSLSAVLTESLAERRRRPRPIARSRSSPILYVDAHAGHIAKARRIDASFIRMPL